MKGSFATFSEIRRKWIAKFPKAFRGAGFNMNIHIHAIAYRSLAKADTLASDN